MLQSSGTFVEYTDGPLGSSGLTKLKDTIANGVIDD